MLVKTERASPRGSSTGVAAPLARTVRARRYAAVVAWVWGERFALLALGISYLLLLHTSTWMQGFVDEGDNFLGGYLIARGYTLYTDYFSHHMPLPYYLAALASLLGASTGEHFRLFVTFVVLGFWTFIVFRFRSSVPRPWTYALILGIGLVHPVFWGHMLLAETILSYCVLILVLYCYAYPDLNVGVKDQVVISLLVYAGVMSTLMAVYPLLPLGLYLLWRLGRTFATDRKAIDVKRLLRFGAILATPFAVTLALLVATGTFRDLLDQAITFNRVYYAQFVLSPDPLRLLRRLVGSYARFVLVYVQNWGVFTLDGFLIAMNALAVCLVARQRGIPFGLAYGSAIVLARLRGVAFHDQGYYLLSLLSAAVAISAGASEVRRAAAGVREAVAGGNWRLPSAPSFALARGLAAGVVLLWAGWASVDRVRAHPWGDEYRSYGYRYAQVVAALSRPDERVWIGPLDPQAFLAVQRAPATRYAFYLPWLSASPAINERLLSDFERSRPPVVVFYFDLMIARYEGTEYQRFYVQRYAQQLIDYLSDQYVSVDAQDPNWKYVFLRRERADELRGRLREAGLYAGAGLETAHAGSGRTAQ